jgi:hypothetical protein
VLCTRALGYTKPTTILLGVISVKEVNKECGRVCQASISLLKGLVSLFPFVVRYYVDMHKLDISQNNKAAENYLKVYKGLAKKYQKIDPEES